MEKPEAPPSRRDEILDAAERMIRAAGYNAFSTRDVAEAVGIKAASVHYHFPTKADIGVAVTRRYTERFLLELGEPAAFKGNLGKTIAHYADAFRRALKRDGKLCVCAVLGAEIGGLPADVGEHTRMFFERNLEWLTGAMMASSRIGAARARRHATLVLAALEGALIVSKSLGDESVFARVADGLENMRP